MPFPITAAIADFASSQRFEGIPEEALAAMRMAFADIVGCMHAAIGAEGPRIIRDNLDTLGLRSDARLYLLDHRASPADAARANASAGAWLEFDDVALRGSHPSSILATALLAQGDAGGASGRSLLTAYAVGFEAWARLIERESDPYIDRGWHGTAVIGCVAAAAALANLERLSPAQAACALGLAASAAGGLTASFGSDARAYHVGLAAAEAVNVVRLARAGLTGSRTALESPRGLLAALSPRGRLDLETPIDDLGREWRLAAQGINLKRYPMALSTHRALDGFGTLLDDLRRDVARLAAITVFIGPAQAAHLAKLAPTATPPPLARVEVGLAALLFDGEVRLSHLESAFLERPDVAAFMKRVSIETDPAALPDAQPNLGYSGRVKVMLAGGGERESPPAAVPRGNRLLPMSMADMWEKFARCTADTLADDARHALFESLHGLDRVASIRLLNA